MKRVLTKKPFELYHYKNGKKVPGKNEEMSGDCTGLSGCCTGLFGDCTGIFGCCTGFVGDLDTAGLTPEERKAGVDINDLVTLLLSEGEKKAP
jgi:hypothetical protein